VGCFKN